MSSAYSKDRVVQILLSFAIYDAYRRPCCYGARQASDVFYNRPETLLPYIERAAGISHIRSVHLDYMPKDENGNQAVNTAMPDLVLEIGIVGYGAGDCDAIFYIPVEVKSMKDAQMEAGAKIQVKKFRAGIEKGLDPAITAYNMPFVLIVYGCLNGMQDYAISQVNLPPFETVPKKKQRKKKP